MRAVLSLQALIGIFRLSGLLDVPRSESLKLRHRLAELRGGQRPGLFILCKREGIEALPRRSSRRVQLLQPPSPMTSRNERPPL